MLVACALWTATAFVARPTHHQYLPTSHHRVTRPVAITGLDLQHLLGIRDDGLIDVRPLQVLLVVFNVGWVAVWAPVWRDAFGPVWRNLAQFLASPPPAAPTPAPLPVPELLTPEGQRLCLLLADRPAEFSDSWSKLLSSLGTADDLSNTPGSSLQARIAEVQRREGGRRVLVDTLGLAVAHTFSEEGLELLPSAADISPGASLPPGAATLVRVSQQFPGQSAKQVQAYVKEAAPLSDVATCGRVDRLQAAQLYLGHVQFGYFIAQIFRGQAGLSDESVVSAQEAQQIKGRIEQAAQMMRSEVAWAAASRRAGGLFGLPGHESSTSLGVEDLRLFSKGVQVVASAQQAEFFSSPSAEAERDEVVAATMAEALPSASFIPFNAAGLQCALAEACLFGWHLWGAEAAASAALGDATARALMTPPERGPPS